METNLLQEIGLTPGETKIYTALLVLGTTTVGPIVEKSGVSASKAYQILDKLGQKGLVSHVIKANTKYFSPAEPTRIIDYLTEKEEAIQEQKSKINSWIAEVLARRTFKGTSVEVFEGIKGLKTVFEFFLSKLQKSDKIDVFGSPAATGADPAKRAFLKNWHDRRAAKGIRARIIFNESARSTLGSDREATPLTEVKYLPGEYITPAAITLFQDWTMITIWLDQPLVLLVRNPDFSSTFRAYFELLWQQKTQTLHGLDGIKAIMEETLNHKEVLFIGGQGQVTIFMPDYFFNSYNPRRIKKNCVWRVLYPSNIDIKARFRQNLEGMELKPLPLEYVSPNVIWVYGNKVANVLWLEQPIVFVTEDATLAASYRQYFNGLWGSPAGGGTLQAKV